MGIAVPIEDSGRQHHQKPTMKAFVASSVMALAATTGASPAADPALVYAGIPAVGGVVAPVVGTVDTGLKYHPASGAVTPDFTAEQKEAAPELAANQKDIKHLAYTGHHIVQHPVLHTGYTTLYGKREAEAEPEADPALLYTTAGHVVAPTHIVAAPAVYTKDGLVAHPNGAVTPDYTPAQKVAAANHLALKGYPVLSGIHYTLGKREADAKAEPWLTYGLSPYAPTAFYSGIYSSPYVHWGKRSTDAEPKSDAYVGYGLSPYVHGGFYGGYAGYPYVGYGKRSADAEPKSDAYLGYGLSPYVHGGLYGGYAGYPYVGYGKRSADAGPKSDAYLGYGYGLSPYAHGAIYSGLPYYGYGKRSADSDADAYWVGRLVFVPTYSGYNRQLAYPYGHFLAPY